MRLRSRVEEKESRVFEPDGQVTACVVSYHNGRHTLMLHFGNKLHMFGISSTILGALAQGAVAALVQENKEKANEDKRDENRELKNRTEQDRLWLNRTVAAIDPLCGGLGASTTASEIWRKHVSDIRAEPEHSKSEQGDV
jgi:hypothetical protein